MATPSQSDRPLFVKRLETMLERLARRPIWLIRPKAYSPHGVLYAAINRRMLAAMVDSAILTLCMAPFNEFIMRISYGGMRVDSLQLGQVLSAAGDSPEAAQSILRILLDSGVLQAFAVLIQIQFTVFAAYSFTCWHFWSATPGKLLLGMRIVDANTGAPIADRQSFMRLIGYVLSGLPLMLGFFAIGWNRQSRGWHDYVAGTAVVVTGGAKRRLVSDANAACVAPSAEDAERN